MSHTLIIWLFAGWFVLFLILGQAVATVLLGAGMVGIVLWTGTGVLGGLVGQDTFYTASSYTLSIIPLYLLMAQLLVKGGVVLDIFRVGYRLSGHRRFPLGVATILTGGLLGAVSGSAAASAAALSRLAGPELEKVGYTRNFSVALAALSGSLSAIIPPSLLIMIYGSLASVPIGHLFIGAIGPAVLCIVVYIVALRFLGQVTPGAVDGLPPDAADDPAERRGAMGSFVFVLALMLMVFGGIYGGVVTVGEAGALGAALAMTGMIAMRRVSLRAIGEALVDSVKVSAMLVMLLIGAQVFSRFLSFSRVPAELLQMTQPLIEQPYLLLTLVLLGVFLAGTFMEEVTIIVLMVPIILPIVDAAQIDMVWFGVMSTFMLSLGLLTPPVGLVTFSAATAAGLPAGPVFRPVMLFATIVALVVGVVMVVFPPIVTWLPSHLN